MFEEPTIEDFTSWIEWHLTKRRDEAERAIDGVARTQNAAGRYRSGSTVILISEEVLSALDQGADTALGELKRAIKLTRLDRVELRRITVALLAAYLERIKALPVLENIRNFAPAKELDKRLSKLDESLSFKIRQYNVGFYDPEEPDIPLDNSNNINIGVMAGGAVQQGTENSTQKTCTETALVVHVAMEALSAFEAAIDTSKFASADSAEIEADIATIKAQLKKSNPSQSILREAGRSLRNIIEGALGGALSGPAVAALWKALGLG